MNIYLKYWCPVRCIAYDGMHCFQAKGRYWAAITGAPTETSIKKVKRKQQKTEEFINRTGQTALAYQLSEEETTFVNTSCRSHRLSRSLGSGLRPFLIQSHVIYLKGHDW